MARPARPGPEPRPALRAWQAPNGRKGLDVGIHSASRAARNTAAAEGGAPEAGRRERRRGRRAPRSTRRRVLFWTAGTLAALLVAGTGVGAYLYQRLDGNIRGYDIEDDLGDNRPANLSPGAKNILVVGSDSREGTGGKYGSGFETMQSDTLMLVHIAANREWATVVSLPRDSWVEVPSCDQGDGRLSKAHHAKINSAFAIGGLSGEVKGALTCAVKAVEQNTGLRVDHFMSLDFNGFKGMVDALDGVEVCPEQPIRDKKANLDLAAGCQTLNGEESLGYVRTRYGVGDNSDIGRIGRQQDFLKTLAEKARSKLTDPKALFDFLEAFTSNLATDRAMAGIDPLRKLATSVQGIPSDRLTFLTVPNYPRELDHPTDRANVVWQYPQADTLFTRLANDEEVDKKELTDSAEESLDVRPSTTRVQVLNGTDTPGRAGEVAEELRRAGFQVVATGNAEEPAQETAIRYPQGMDVHADALAGRLQDAAVSADDATTPGLLTLVIGADFTGLRG
ncbi:LCP family protein [Streptomyces chumphonensis]|uniref:LCP family protein n=1 Tax=Streptomyces chumphonensis TaxID=1214925 RepID=A0A927F055_9ACTN|nr:LCP family protein [Streptomyces chumphonensis]